MAKTNTKLPTLKRTKVSVKGTKLKSIKAGALKGTKFTPPKIKAPKKVTVKVASPLKFKA